MIDKPLWSKFCHGRKNALKFVAAHRVEIRMSFMTLCLLVIKGALLSVGLMQKFNAIKETMLNTSQIYTNKETKFTRFHFLGLLSNFCMAGISVQVC